MKSKNELKGIYIKNRACYYFDDIINGTKINFTNILLDKELYENISVYNILYKTLTCPKPLRIRFDKIDGFILSLDGKIKHLILFGYGLFNKICDKIKHLISKKIGITNSTNHNFGKIRIDSHNFLLIKKTLTSNKNKYYYNIIFKKGSHKDK